MDTLTWVLFESRIALGIFLGLVLFGLLVYWRRTLKPRPLLIGLAVAVVLLIVQTAVVTRREHAQRIMRTIEFDILNARTSAILGVLARDFRAGGRDRPEFISLVQAYMNRIQVHTLRRGRLEIEAGDAETFSIYVQYGANVTIDEFATPFPSSWQIRFIREDDLWRIIEILPRTLGQQSIRTWEQLERF